MRDFPVFIAGSRRLVVYREEPEAAFAGHERQGLGLGNQPVPHLAVLDRPGGCAALSRAAETHLPHDAARFPARHRRIGDAHWHQAVVRTDITQDFQRLHEVELRPGAGGSALPGPNSSGEAPTFGFRSSSIR